MRKLKLIGAAFALALVPAAAHAAADCCKGTACCKDGGDCCKEKDRKSCCTEMGNDAGKAAPDDHAGHNMPGMDPK